MAARSEEISSIPAYPEMRPIPTQIPLPWTAMLASKHSKPGLGILAATPPQTPGATVVVEQRSAHE